LSSDSGFISGHHYNMNSTIDTVTSNCSAPTPSIAPGSSRWLSSQEKSSGVVGATGGGGMPIGRKELWDDDAEGLAELFGRLGLGKYTDLFQQQEVSLQCPRGQLNSSCSEPILDAFSCCNV
jgi:hypothetical protein